MKNIVPRLNTIINTTKKAIYRIHNKITKPVQDYLTLFTKVFILDFKF